MSVPGLEIREEQDGQRVLIAVSGEIDMATVGGLRDALEQAAGANGDVWLDLSEVEFMDSTGLTELVRRHNAMNDGRRLNVICPAGAARRAIEVSGLDAVLHLSDSR